MSDDLDEFGLAGDHPTTTRPGTQSPLKSSKHVVISPRTSSFVAVPKFTQQILSISFAATSAVVAPPDCRVRDTAGETIARATALPILLPADAHSIELVNPNDAAMDARIVFGLSL